METVPFYKISTPGNYVILWHLRSGTLLKNTEITKSGQVTYYKFSQFYKSRHFLQIDVEQHLPLASFWIPDLYVIK